MPRETDPFWKYVKLLPNKHWNCNFCGNSYAGSATRIKAHLAGVGGYGINDCKDVDGRVRSEARKAMKGKTVVESSSGPDNDEVGLHQPVIASNEDGRRETSFVAMPYLSSNAISNGQPVIASNEDGRRETSFVAMPYLSSNAISTVGASSSDFHPLHEMNVPSQYLPTQNITIHGDIVFWTQPPQSHAVNSNIQPWNLSHLSSGRDLAPQALTHMPPPVNAEEGEPNAEVPEGANSPPSTPLPEMDWITELFTKDISFGPQPSQNTIPLNAEEGEPGIVVPQGASSSAFLPLPETNLPISSCPAELITTETDFPFGPQPPQNTIPLNAEEGEPSIVVPQDVRMEDAVMVSRPGNGGLVDENVPSLKRKRRRQSNRKVVNNYHYYRVRKLSTTHATGCRKSSPLIQTKLVGGQSEETINKICDYLMEDEIVIIGIYGMGGVGKTAILKHVHNKVLENPTFNDAFWVTVPQEFSICELQDEIANAIGLDNLSKDRDTERRASLLNRHLKKKRAVLMLDGLWVHFDYEDVGIPLEKGGIKLVLTTRSLDVCDKMVCQKKVKINPLERPDDCWVLFLNKLCFGRDLPSEVKKIASSILCKCRGLPLGIIEIATHLRGLQEVHEWEDFLQELENSIMELDVFKKLKLTYMNLRNLQVQQCFLHLILCFGEWYFEEENIKKVLIESFIDEGLLSGRATRQELHKKGNTILDKLKKACVGVDIHRECLSIHPLIGDMALQIVTNTTHMVKANMGLKEIPEEELWTDHLEKVFLQNNDIKVIPYSISPNCPKLTRLSLNNNASLEAIHKSFFRHMKGLKVLDLSRTKIMELPDTISDLESLEALLLRECEKLCHIPCVQKLGCLRKLDLSGCAMLEEVPEGMEMLAKLTYLDLLGTKIKVLPEGVLGKLVNLQYLVINFMMDEEVEVELTIVEGLYCSVLNVETFNACVRLVEQNSSQPYDLALSASGNYFFKGKHERRIIIESCHSIAATVDGEIGGDGRAILPRNVQVLKVGWCSGLTSLSEVGPLNNLEELKIKEWEKLEELGAVHFPCLRRLKITQCTKLKHFLKEGHELRCLQWFKIEGLEELEEINIAAPFLYNIEVYRCPKMKWVVKWQWLATRLPNLRSIKIKNCEQLDEIVSGLPPIGATCRLTKIDIEGCNNLKGVLMTHDMLLNLPFLQHVMVEDCMGIEAIIGIVPNMTQPLHLIDLTLTNLPELKTICEGTVSWLSIQYMRIDECPKLKRLHLLDKGPCYDDDICIDKDIWIDELTWQSLEWDHSPFHPSLQHLARRYGVSNGHDQRICVRIESRDAITARVDVLIGGDGRNLLPRNVQVLEVGGGSGVTSLSEVGPLENLEELTIKNCEKLEELGAVHFPQLEGLDINCCSKLKRLSVEGQGLPHLRWFAITGSEELEAIDLAAPNLNFMEVRRCRKMKRVVEWDWLTTRLPNLKSIGLVYCEELKEIIGGPLPIGSTCLLTKISITRCNNMKGVLLTHDMLLHIPFLQDIRIEDCEGIEVIIGTAPNMTQSSFPKLTRLTLGNLPKLKRICDRMESCDHIQYIEIEDCRELKSIPLRLHPLDNGLLSPPPSLGQIWIDDKETWQALEWDHPLAPISLEPFIEFFYDRWGDRICI